MKKSTKIWLWIALVICVLTTTMNASMSRYPSVVFACISIIGLLTLLLQEAKQGFYILCVGYALSFVTGIVSTFGTDTSIVVAIIMSFVGSIIIPGITALFLRSDWKNLK